VVSALIHGLHDACAALRPWGVEVGVAGGETADIGDLVRTVTFDCALTTRVARACVVDNARIAAGDLIVGLASSGPAAAYEGAAAYNSGIGANGLTAARHDVLGQGLAARYPESYDPGLPPHLIYSGGRGLTETVPPEWGVPAAGLTVGQLLLSPTRTYAPILARLLDPKEGLLDRQALHGLVHCSGGGQTKALRCLPFPPRPPLRLVKDALFDTPAVFQLIHAEQLRQKQQQEQQEQQQQQQPASASALWREMHQVFNMGHRLEAYVADERAARAVIDTAASLGVEAKVVGRVEAGPAGAKGHSLEIRGLHGDFVYT
jgi:phosphoribosylformylglycinamidine cyclo-ligase